MSIVASSPDLVPPDESPSVPWRRSLAQAVRDPIELCRLLQLEDSWERPARRAAATFPLLAPREFIARMQIGDPDDPLLKQVLPLGEELVETPGFTSDPVSDRQATVEPGLLTKYEGRALLIATGHCAVYCRYCFRRHYSYAEAPRSAADWEPALARLAADTTIREVILSGGDPLTLSDAKLAHLASSIAKIPHVRRLRIHTRLPIMIPQRVDDELLDWLRGTRLTPTMVIHANHPAEIDHAVRRAMGRLVDAGVPVLNQAVLLRGINDDADVLTELCERLVDLRVMPYYLHQLDRVSGAAHFEVDSAKGKELVAAIRTRLPGYAVPRYVQEWPGEPSKRPLT